ncbi:hypothetical protein EJ08DRAFT_694976 [Tothia fuscella]|uniref:Flap structure-specific endonuclease n=1 Tax=Tothia fuscella TaxID=1048955 RepID=A0A9P4NV98_9PEZI|nr:hypothetical protein EJ08DRAFT_694976 [Tothia fuscella]
MGIHGIYKEIGPGERIAFSKYALDHFERTGEPFRVAIDVSIWLFQIQSGKGGSNPALRTFYYRLLRLISISVHPLFVFDGPNKPPFKRNKRTGPNVASIPEFLAKQLLKQFGFPFHIAPGEAEAECALIQREGIVDAVLSEDVDTLMFGSGLTFRNWTPEYNKSGGPTHVNLYDAKVTKAGSGLDREGMVLIALMSGGDYITEGIPGCGPKTACEAARAGFGAELCKISRKDKTAMKVWREKLAYELHTNESKHFKRKHGKLEVPEDFPNIEVLGYYTHPCISPPDKILRLRESLKWDQDLNLPELRTFTAEAFDWTKLGGAKKFIRNLAPALLVRALRLRNQNGGIDSQGLDANQEQEAKLLKAIHGKRNHQSTDNVTELRISFTPHNLVPIDLDAEEPDDEIPVDSGDEALEDDNIAPGEAPTSPSKKRGPPTYDPTDLEKIWLFETWAKVGVPLKVQDWEQSMRNPFKSLAMKHANKGLTKAGKPRKQPAAKVTKSNMPTGALDRFTKVTKPGLFAIPAAEKSKAFDEVTFPSSSNPFPPTAPPSFRAPNLHPPRSTFPTAGPEIINLISSPALPIRTQDPEIPFFDLPPTVTKRRRSPLRRTQTDTAVLDLTASSSAKPRSTTPPRLRHFPIMSDSPTALPSPSQFLPQQKRAKRATSVKPQTPTKVRKNTPVELSSPPRQSEITSYFSPTRRRDGMKASSQRDRDPPPQFRRPTSPIIEGLDLTASSPPAPRLAKIFKRTAVPIGQEDGASFVLEPFRPSNDSDDLVGSPRRSLQEIHANVVDSQAEARRSQSSSKSSSQESSRSRMTTAPQSQDHPEEVDLSQDQDLPTRFKHTTKLNTTSSHHAHMNTFKEPPPPRRSPRSHQMSSVLPPPVKGSRTAQLKKKVVRVRDSLPGAFAIEEIDLSEEVVGTLTGVERTRKVLRMSEIGFLDLTGD